MWDDINILSDHDVLCLWNISVGLGMILSHSLGGKYQLGSNSSQLVVGQLGHLWVCRVWKLKLNYEVVKISIMY